MKSVMTKDFSRVATTDITHSKFDRSHGLKTAFDSGYLVPIELQEVLPADTVDFHIKSLVRLAPVVTPVMDNIFIDLQAFFIPSRLVWTNFVKMMGERVNPRDSIDYLVPEITLGKDDLEVGGLPDYFGIPMPQSWIPPEDPEDLENWTEPEVMELKVSVLPFRCYQKVYDDWYRDENLQDSVIQSTDELGDEVTDPEKWLKLRKRGKRHDYFTSALPWPMRGEGVNLPLGKLAPVITQSKFAQRDVPEGAAPMYWQSLSNGNAVTANDNHAAIGIESGGFYTVAGGLEGSYINSNDAIRVRPANLFADLSQASSATIASLRLAFQLQALLETDARAGVRYCELIRAHFKTVCPDARLQRSEFLGSCSVPVQTTPIAQTSATVEGQTPQGNLAATGHAYVDFKFSKSFTEHGYIIVLASVRCDLNYQQGLDRLWTRRSRYEYYWPTLAHLSEQEVLNKEIYLQGDNVTDDLGNPIDNGLFGYQERYAEYRYNPSKITGKMRSGVNGSLDVWHLAQDFDGLPKLSSEFIEENPPLDRVLAVTEGEPQILAEFYLGQIWSRAMPVYSIPGLVSHF